MVSKTPDISLTRDMVRRAATSAIYARGNNYFKSGRVLECVEIEPGVVEGTVSGSGSNAYSTNIDFSAGYMVTDCSCPYGWTNVCKHAVALALEYLHMSLKTDYRQPKQRLRLSPFNSQANSQTTAPGNNSGTISNSGKYHTLGATGNNENDNKETAWREVLDQLVEPSDPQGDVGLSRVIYRLEMTKFGGLMLRTTKARIGKNGKGKESYYHYDRFAPSGFLRKKDNAILGLMAHGSFLRISDTISDEILDPLLRLLHDEEYVYAGESNVEVSIALEPIKAKLILQENGDNHELRVSLEANKSNSTLLAEKLLDENNLPAGLEAQTGYSTALTVLGEDNPWITDGYSFYPLDTHIPGSVLAGLISQPRTIGRDQIDSFMETYYDALAQKESIEIKSSLVNSIRDDVVPRPILYLESKDGTLIMKPCFAYGDGPPQVEPGSMAMVLVASMADESVWVRRQVEIENDFYRELEYEGIEFYGSGANGRPGVNRSVGSGRNNRNSRTGDGGNDSIDGGSAVGLNKLWGIGRMYGEEAIDFLYISIDKLRDRGWEIVSKAETFRINRNAPKVSASVSSGIDWFDLDFAFNYGNITAELATVLAAYKSGQKYIRLDDGSWGTLPMEWLDKSSFLLDELTGLDDSAKTRSKKYLEEHEHDKKHDGEPTINNALRVRNHLLPMIEDMVSDIDLQSSVRFDDLRTRLNSFNGLDKVDSPDGLNATLRDYQHKGLDWLAFLETFSFGGILADDMGLGKTIQALAHLLRLKENEANWKEREATKNTENKAVGRPSLIVAPTSVAYNWKEEAARFAPDLKVIVITGPDRHSQFEAIGESDIVVTTYALLRRDFKMLSAHSYRYIVLDEAQYIKNPMAQTTKLCKTLTASHRLALSGTPIENNLTELWSIFDFLMPGFLGSHKSFRERYERPITKAAKSSEASNSERGSAPSYLANINRNVTNVNKNDIERNAISETGINDIVEANIAETSDAQQDSVLAMHAMERLRKRIKPFILRRLKQEVATELPPKTEMINFCEMTPAQNNLYRQVLNTYRAKVFETISKKGVERSQITILDALLKLRQVCNHPQLLKIAANNVQTSGKMDALKEMVEQIVDEGHRALVFSQFTQMLGIVRHWLDLSAIPYCYLDGRTRNRQQIIDSFNNNDIPLFLISLKAGGTGLNLTAADYVIHIDPWWNPAVENQATDRAYRIGQDKHVFVYKLITKNSVEEKILKLQDRKKELVDNLLSEGRIGKSLTREDLDELFSIT